MLQTVGKVIDSDKALLEVLSFHKSLSEMEDEKLIETLPNGDIYVCYKDRCARERSVEERMSQWR